MIYKKKCIICGKEFETDKVNKTICNDIYCTKYVICSNSIELKIFYYMIVAKLFINV